MKRSILGLIVGLAVWVLVASLLNRSFRFGLEGYAAAEPQMTFTHAMMAARLALGALASLAAGAPLVPQVIERLPDLPAESIGNRSGLVLVPQWRNEVPDAHPRCLAFPVSHFANVLRPADFDELGFIALLRVVRPVPKGLVAGQMPLDRLVGLGRVDLADARRRGHQQESGDQQ